MMDLQQLLLLMQLCIEVTGDKMNKERRVIDILKDDGSFRSNIGRELYDLGRQILDIGDIRLKVLFRGGFLFLQKDDLRLEIGIFRRYGAYFKTPFPLKDNGSAPIRH